MYRVIALAMSGHERQRKKKEKNKILKHDYPNQTEGIKEQKNK